MADTTIVASPGPVQIGSVVLAFGPYKIQITKTPRVAVQQGQATIFRWDYGWQPTSYRLEGYSVENALSLAVDLVSDVAVAHQIVDQFADGVTPQKLLIPTAGVQDMVVLTSAELDEDAQNAPGEPSYVLTFASADV